MIVIIAVIILPWDIGPVQSGQGREGAKVGQPGRILKPMPKPALIKLTTD